MSYNLIKVNCVLEHHLTPEIKNITCMLTLHFINISVHCHSMYLYIVIQNWRRLSLDVNYNVIGQAFCSTKGATCNRIVRSLWKFILTIKEHWKILNLVDVNFNLVNPLFCCKWNKGNLISCCNSHGCLFWSTLHNYYFFL